MGAAFGVGVVFNPVVPHFLAAHPDTVDYVEVIPETTWTDRGRRVPADRYEPVAAAVAEVRALAARYPIACHGIGLSIGSATPLDEQHLTEVRRFADAFGVTRISEHLGFSRVRGPDGDHHVGLGFPLPCDHDVLAWMIDRVGRSTEILGRSLILENGVCHTPIVEQDMTEPEFLNRLGEATGCGVLLDLHNLYTDHRNGGPRPATYVDRLELSRVREIHVAGGSTIGRAYTDSHAGPCPPEVWELLVDVAPRCPNLEGITFEFHDSYYPRMGRAGLCEQLLTARQAWAGLGRGRHVA